MGINLINAYWRTSSVARTGVLTSAMHLLAGALFRM
jgi:hypothetical protein